MGVTLPSTACIEQDDHFVLELRGRKRQTYLAVVELHEAAEGVHADDRAALVYLAHLMATV